MKSKFLIKARDSLFATFFTVLSVLLLSNIPLDAEILNPISKTFNDFQLTDIYFSHIKENPPHNEEIVIVNIGPLQREGIAELVSVINQYEPAVIGIDAFFREMKPDKPEGDFKLAMAFSQVENLVLVSELLENEEESTSENTVIDSVAYSHPMFMAHAQPAFADMVVQGHGKFNTARVCVPQQSYNDSILHSFPVTMAGYLAPDKVEKFLARGNDVEDINYQGNIITDKTGATKNTKNVFYALDYDQVLNRQFTPDLFKDKIVFMGYLGDYIGGHSWTDKFFTPLNKEYLGKTMPDMYGVVVHANIAGMILNEEYINIMPVWLEYLLSIIFIFINVWIFSFMFFKWHMWYDGASLLVSFIEVIILTALLLTSFMLYHYKFDITFPIVAIFLMGNLIELYFGLLHPGYSKLKKKNRSRSGKSIRKNQETYEV